MSNTADEEGSADDHEVYSSKRRWDDYAFALIRVECMYVVACQQPSGYLRRRRRPQELDTERMLDIILWLDRQFRGGGPKLWKISLSKLTVLDHWLDEIAAGDPRFASPLGECVHSIGGLGNKKGGRLDGLDTSIANLGHIWSKVRLAEFSGEIRPSLGIGEIHAIRATWEGLAPAERQSLAEECTWEPHEVIGSVLRFIEGTGFFFPSTLPFHGSGTKLPHLRPYLRKLDALMASIAVLELLARRFSGDADGSVKQIKHAVEKERARIVDLGESLADQESGESKESCMRAVAILNIDGRQTSPGRIRPYTLFRYAAQRGWLRDLLARDRPAPKKPKATPK